MKSSTSAAEAQSLEPVLSGARTLEPSEAQALKPFAQDLLNHIRDVLIQDPPAVSIEPAEPAATEVDDSAFIPESLLRHLLEQQARVVELEETLQMLAAHINEGAGVVAGCVRVARDVNVALDANSLRRVLEGAEEAQAA